MPDKVEVLYEDILGTSTPKSESDDCGEFSLASTLTNSSERIYEVIRQMEETLQKIRVSIF